MHAGCGAILIGDAECVLGMAGLIGEGCASKGTSVHYLYRHGNEIRIISWTAWHSAAAATGTSSRIRDAYNDVTNRNGFLTNCIKDLVSHLQLSGIHVHFIHL